MLDTSASRAGQQSPLKGAVTAVLDTPPSVGVNNLNAKGRLDDMDTEGIDVHLIIPATFALAVTMLDGEMASEVHAAYRRYIGEYCSADPSRLKATVPVLADRSDESAAIIREIADEPWVAAITPVLPPGLPIDDPVLDPIWQAMNDADLPIMHHSFFYEPPYFPGYRDIWDNVVVARAAAHPWGAQRLLGYLLLSGVFDQYPNLRIGFAECSAGWLPAWLVRLRGQADYMKRALPEGVRDPLDYAREGRVFCGIELYEGEAIAKSINDLLGDGVIMYQSDYPHNGCEYPNSPDIALGWTGLGEQSMRKLMHDNAAAYLRM